MRRWHFRVLSPLLVGVGGIVLVTQAGRWSSGWPVVGFVIAGLGAAAGLVSTGVRAEPDRAHPAASEGRAMLDSSVVNAAGLIRVYGGGTIPLPGIGGVSLSVPLVVLDGGPAGVRVGPRWRSLRSLIEWLMRWRGASEANHAEWVTKWSWLDRAVISKRSIVLYGTSGYPCRFVTHRGGAIAPIEALLVENSVRIERVGSTVRYAAFWRPPHD
jgi:hypothetical protein